MGTTESMDLICAVAENPTPEGVAKVRAMAFGEKDPEVRLAALKAFMALRSGALVTTEEIRSARMIRK
jgi:hypothetical protein